MPRALKSLGFGLLLLAALGAEANAWWNSEWTARRKVTLDTSESGMPITDPIGSAPILVRLYDGNFNFADAKEDGTDLRFVAADDKTELPFHMEKWDNLLNEAFVWVKAPDLKAGAKVTFYIYYGNSGPKATRADNQKGTYDKDTQIVYHFAEHSAPAGDSSGNGNNAKNAGVPNESSIIGTGLLLDGKSVVTVDAAPSLAWTDGTPLTWTAWIKFATAQPNAVLFSRSEGGKSFSIGLKDGIPYVDAAGTASAGTAAITPAAWHHLGVVAETNKITIYVDGEVSTSFAAAIPALNSALAIGGFIEGKPDGVEGFVGEIDELEISKAARTPGFIKLAAIGQNGDKAGKLLMFDQPEQTSSGPNLGYFGIIIKNLTPDGWAVICILLVMAAISWFVMITKAAYLSRVAKGNSLFLKQWEHVASDLTALDSEDPELAKSMGGRVDRKGQRALRDASVYRIYHIGAEEIRKRLASGKNAGAGTRILSANAIPAIRASLDGGLVRETQRLNSAMVLLTIAISGGPFLGLLGTVVGVMITFAAIAAAGDVNVNSIAPGIAAALLATVAGLAVAIPSLFGYNYLLGRVKNTTSDMHVFIDEFITKIAEFYCVD